MQTGFRDRWELRQQEIAGDVRNVMHEFIPDVVQAGHALFVGVTRFKHPTVHQLDHAMLAGFDPFVQPHESREIGLTEQHHITCRCCSRFITCLCRFVERVLRFQLLRSLIPMERPDILCPSQGQNHESLYGVVQRDDCPLPHTVRVGFGDF